MGENWASIDATENDVEKIKAFISPVPIHAKKNMWREIPVSVEQNMFCRNKIDGPCPGVGFLWHSDKKSCANGGKINFCLFLKDERKETPVNHVRGQVPHLF